MGYALKMAGANAVCISDFGDGAASEGDVHPALNMASTLEVIVVLF
jgi:TPP-dependent pyruvate/acetoin dehydrogenase alpha subunit